MLRSIRLKRTLRRNRQRLAFLLGRLRGYRYVFSDKMQDIIDSQALPGEPQRAIIIVSFHVSGMYGLLKISEHTRPIACLVTKEAEAVLKFLGLRPRYVRFVSDLSTNDIRKIQNGEEYLLVFADVNTSNSKMVHVPVYGKARVFSASWVFLAKSLGARVVAVTCLRDRQTFSLDGLDLDLQSPPAAVVWSAFEFMQQRVPNPNEWDMIVSHSHYPDCMAIGAEAADQWQALAASDLEVSRMIADARANLGAAKTQDAVHATESKTI